jgi:hypothetical protein
MGRLSDEYAAQGKTSMFERLKPFVDPINSQAASSYEDVARTLGVSLGSVGKLIFRLRKRAPTVRKLTRPERTTASRSVLSFLSAGESAIESGHSRNSTGPGRLWISLAAAK